MKVVAADSGQIEARVTAWLAGHERLLELFRDPKRDVYGEQGTEFFRRPINKKDTPDERQVSKCMVLGMGYGMGWRKFAGEMLKGMMGAKPMQFGMRDVTALGVDLAKFRADPRKMNRVEQMPSRLPLEDRATHCAVADELVRRYRATNAPIVKLWAAMEQLIEAMETPAAWGKRAGPVTVQRHALILPNGMPLKYPGLAKGDDGWTCLGGRGGKERVRLYGGHMTENVVQALARIIVAEQMIEIRAMGYRIATMTHDEVVVVVEDAQAETALADMLRVMKTAPEWCRGLPLNAEGGFAQRYGEAKG